MTDIIIPRNGVDRIFKDYNEIDRYDINEPADIARKKQELVLCDHLGREILNHYPNREWKIIADFVGGIVIIACDSLSLNRGYFIRLEGKTVNEITKKAVTACGEILERFNISRNKYFNSDELETIKRDFQGEAIASDAAPENISKKVH